MKRNRTIGLYAAASSLLLCVAAFAWLGREMLGTDAHAHHSGERLRFATLRPNEFIHVKGAHGDRGVRIREYRFYCAAGARHVDIRGNTDSIDNTMTALVRGRELLPAEAGGIDALVDWFRKRGEEPAIGAWHYEIAYFRNNQPIGDEFFIGYRMPQELAYFRKVAGTQDAQPDTAYDEIARDACVTGRELDRLFPFEQLEQ